MGPAMRGLYILESEISVVLMAMKRGNMWNSNTNQDANTENLIKEFMALKKSLSLVADFGSLDTVEFLMPFLDVIRSEDVTGYVTGLALSAVHKFLSYDLIDWEKPGVNVAVENLADAVTHARFVGSDPSSDEVVLMKILDVLRILILSRVGLMLTNESICEIMQSTLRICFEPRLSELLRRSAQHCLTDMVQLLFTRLPTFTPTQKPLLKKLKMRSAMDTKGKRKSRTKRSVTPSPKPTSSPSSPREPRALSSPSHQLSEEPSSPTALASPTQTVEMGEVLARSPVGSVQDLSIVSDCEGEVAIQVTSPEGTVRSSSGDQVKKEVQEKAEKPSKEEDVGVQEEAEFTNEAGVTFANTVDTLDSEGVLIPYGLPAVYELLRFLASLINPHEQANSEQQLQIGLNLVSCALEVGVDSLAIFPSLLALTQDEICRNLVSLLSSERIAVFSSALRCCFLLFGSLRSHLKLQLEHFLLRLADTISTESARVSFEQKELSLEALVQLYKLPGFVTELYLNYDCGLYSSNLFEDLTKVLSKNAFPVAGVLSTHQLALEGLTVVLDGIERNCQKRISDRVPQPPAFSPAPRRSSQSQGVSPTLMAQSGGHLFAKMDPVQVGHTASPPQPSLVPTHESLMAIKHRKKLISTGTDQFNVKPKNGIEHLQESRILSKPTDPYEVAHWLRENPHLDKAMIGEYISNKKNLDIFKAFVKSFDFTGLRIDEALRAFLSTFRLPGEAPVISMIMEIFGEHWHAAAKVAGYGLADEDAPYTLAYAVIMLNTDQHNTNAAKNNLPMTQEQFIKNLRGTNGGGDHDPEIMAEIYQAIRNDEIVMPAEQVGLVKENYEWKQLLRRAATEGDFLTMDNGMFDHNLFGLSWGPAVAALSYIFDKSGDPELMRRALDGFSKCAMIAAHYAMSDVLDNLVISLTKFTTLLNTAESPENFRVMYGANSKALLATRAVFSLTHKYGDILREGWKNLVECLLQLFQCRLLPKSLMEAEDYIENGGKVELFREAIPREKEDAGLINSLVSFIVASSEMPRELSLEEEELVAKAAATVEECHPEHLLQESKFLLTESLQELVKFLIAGTALEGEEAHSPDHGSLFYLELLTRITIANRDRVGAVWRGVVDHLHRMISASARTLGGETQFQLERAVTSLLRLGVRLARKEELASTVVQSLRILLAIKPGSIFHVCKQVAYGLHELLRNNAANIHSREDWGVIFTLLEVVGAGASPAMPGQGSEEDSGQGGTSDEGSQVPRERAASGGWIDLGRRASSNSTNAYTIVHTRQIVMHDSVSYLKCCESLSFLVRDVVHVTPENFSLCVAAIRTFVEASYRGEGKLGEDGRKLRLLTRTANKKTPRNSRSAASSARKTRTEPRRQTGYDADESSDDELVGEYTHTTMQLLDLMAVLHAQALEVHTAWERPTTELWDTAWCPVLQGMARLCCDSRPSVRTQALTLLQRSLLLPDLQVLSPLQWEFAFLRVLFPMLRRLLEMGQGQVDRQGRDETKLRASMMLSKVFLQHLTSLASLPTFTALWLTILDLVGQFCASASTDILSDALPESLKNMLLVMDTSGRGLFFTDSGEPTPLWGVTWEKVETFLPGLKEELFPDWQKRSSLKSNGEVAKDLKDQNCSLGTNPVCDPNVEVKPDPISETDLGCGSEGNVELPVTDKLPDPEPPLVIPSMGEHEEKCKSANNPTDEGGEVANGVVEAEADKVVEVEAGDGEVSNDRPQTLPVMGVLVTKDTGDVGDIQEPEEPTEIVEQVGDAEESSIGMSHPQLAALSTTLESSILTSSIVSTQPRERHPSLPGPSLLPPASPSSPIEPPILPFTAFSLPTSPSHTASTLAFSPITPAPSILHPPAPPLATPRPQMAPPAPAPLPPLLPSSSLQHAPSTAFSLPTLPPVPSNILPPSSPTKDEAGVETV